MDEENNNIQAEVETHEEQDDCGEVESEDEGDDEAKPSILTRGIKFASTSEFFSFVNENLPEAKDMEEKNNYVHEEQEECGEVESDGGAGKSILTRGIKFASTNEFLSFVKDEDLPEVEDMEEKYDIMVEMPSQSPVVSLKRLCFEGGVFESKAGGHSKLKTKGRSKQHHAKLKVRLLPSLQSQKARKKSGGKLVVKAKAFEQGSKGESGQKKKKDGGSSSQVSEEDVIATHANRTGNKYLCKLCAYTSDQRGTMRKHLEGTHSLRAGWDCSDCGKHFKHSDSLYRHKKEKNGGCKFLVKGEDVVASHAKREGDKKYHCTLCDYASNLRGNMRTHLEGTHNLGAGWDCEDCGKHFKHRTALYNHKRGWCAHQISKSSV